MSGDRTTNSRSRASAGESDLKLADLRRIRQDKGLTLQQLADHAGLTRGYLSLVERGLKVPSIAALVRLADALGSSVPELIRKPAGETESFAISRARPGPDGNEPARMPYEALIPGVSRKAMEPFLVRPQNVATASNSHNGEELIFVLRGTVELLLNDRVTTLLPGDCAYFDARKDHKLRNVGTEQSEVLVVIADSHPKHLR